MILLALRADLMGDGRKSRGAAIRPLWALVMRVTSLPTFAPSPLRDAWGLVDNRPALLRTRQAGTRAPSALLRAAGLPGANHSDDPLQSEAAMGAPPAGRVPDPQGWV